MTYYQEQHNHFSQDTKTTNNNELSSLQQPKKQTISYILDDDNTYHSKSNNILPPLEGDRKQYIPYEPTSTRTLQRLPSPFSVSSSDDDESVDTLQQQHHHQPTENEIQYIKRIQALMVLVARQTKEIHALREVIASSAHKYNMGDDDHIINVNRKRNKQF